MPNINPYYAFKSLVNQIKTLKAGKLNNQQKMQIELQKIQSNKEIQDRKNQITEVKNINQAVLVDAQKKKLESEASKTA